MIKVESLFINGYVLKVKVVRLPLINILVDKLEADFYWNFGLWEKMINSEN